VLVLAQVLLKRVVSSRTNVVLRFQLNPSRSAWSRTACSREVRTSRYPSSAFVALGVLIYVLPRAPYKSLDWMTVLLRVI